MVVAAGIFRRAEVIRRIDALPDRLSQPFAGVGDAEALWRNAVCL